MSRRGKPASDSTPPTAKWKVVSDQELVKELGSLREEVHRLNGHSIFRFRRVVAEALLMQFLKGAFLALGSLFGASLILSILVYVLSRIELVPILGQWIRELNEFLKDVHP